MPSKNPEIIKYHRDKWYRNNKDKQVARQMARRKELMSQMWDYKRTLTCTDCGFLFKDNPECLDFHHIDPTQKETKVGVAIYSSYTAFLREIAKCIPLCCRCHRIRHRNMYNNA